ncbi:MAG: hypothetical protein CMA08_04135 [Euryarchaeota archaeon]|nr:hypothetical protein [Euryarchaeota archaeon]OUX21522.1 MAG: hypothetical protein CBE12_04030 [Euryarchaeota archaeon TMED252]
MDVDALLEVQPELLARLVLHRRERLAEVIPDQLDSRRQELDAAKTLASGAKRQRDQLGETISGLKAERNAYQAKARSAFERIEALREGMEGKDVVRTPDPAWARERLQARLDAIEDEMQRTAGDHKTEAGFIATMRELVSEHETWVASRTEKAGDHLAMNEARDEARSMLDAAQKAHDAMLLVVNDHQEHHRAFVEQDEGLRRADSRTRRLAVALSESEQAISYWTAVVAAELDADHPLLRAMVKVAEGGASSFVSTKPKEEEE